MKIRNGVNGTSTAIAGGGVASGRVFSRVHQVVIQRNPCRGNATCQSGTIKIGTWNVRTLLQAGKLENAKREMYKNKLDVLGMAEVRWKDCGEIMSDKYRFLYSGGDKGSNGVGLLLTDELAKNIVKVNQKSDRLISVRIKAEPRNLLLIQVYMPTTAHSDEEIEEMYESIEELINDGSKDDFVVCMGDFNAVIGEGKDQSEVGEFGLGQRNERGEMLVDFCRRTKLFASNTWFKHHKRRRYTWKRPGDTERMQLDYILVRQRYRNSVKDSRSLPGADIDSDHNLVACKVKVRLKKIKGGKLRKRWNLDKLINDSQVSKLFREGVDRELENKIRGDENIEQYWSSIKAVITANAEKVVGRQISKRIKKPWVTQEMTRKMDERRMWKGQNSEKARREYRRLNNELRRATDKARQDWWDTQCSVIEEHHLRGRVDLAYKVIKSITRYDTKGGGKVIKDKEGKVLLTEAKAVRDRWREYIGDLYERGEKPGVTDLKLEEEREVEEQSLGPVIINEEILAAIKAMRLKKAEGVDELPAEFWKVIGPAGVAHVSRLCQQIYMQGRWPLEWVKTIMVPIPKKCNAVECGDFRTISLIPHVSKILLKVLHNRIEGRVEEYLGKTQFGFRKGVGTRDAIGVLRMLSERIIEFNKEMYVCFVDFEKAFDRVNWVKLMEVLKEVGVDWRDRRLLIDLYMQQEVAVRVNGECTESTEIGRGVRQGCLLSPLLFNLYAEAMIKDVMLKTNVGVRIGGEVLADIRFADDQAMAAETNDELQQLMDMVNSTAKEYGMKINGKKTKVMKISRDGVGQVRVVLEGQELEQVEKFKYLGVWVTSDGRSSAEIRCRIAVAKAAYTGLNKLLTGKLSKSLKKRIVKAVVWSTLLYGSETWTLRKEEKNRIEAFEMWVWRRMEKIPYTAHKTNEAVLSMVGEERQLLNTILQRQKNWLGHVMRGEGLMKLVMEGCVEGRRGVGRRRFGMLHELLGGGNYQELKRRAYDREEWRRWQP